MLSVYFSKSEGHNKSSHCENKLRVEIPEVYLRNIFTPELFHRAELIDYDEFVHLVDESHGEDIIERFKRPKRVICLQCNNRYTTTSCLDCGRDCSHWFLDNDTYFTPKSIECLIESVSTMKTAIDNISNDNRYHYLLIRPPGHHSSIRSSGFCPINNAFLTATYARIKGFNRIFILDYDFHHGNGTSELVNGKDGFFIVSIHGFGTEDYPVYPGTGSINENTTNTINIPLLLGCKEDRKSYDDNYYMNIIEKTVIPLINEFRPDLIIISNGLDAHKDDTLEGMNLTNRFYIETTRKLKTYEVPLVYLLEGGYNPKVIRSVSEDIINELIN